MLQRGGLAIVHSAVLLGAVLLGAVLLGAVLLGGVLMAGGMAPAAAQVRSDNDPPVASDVRVAGDDSLTRFVLDLDKSVDIRAFTLANPYRVVIDMPQVTFQLPSKAGLSGRGLIKAFRFGLVMQGGSRMVLDLARPARIDKAVVLQAANEQPARLVLELASTDREAFMRTTALNNRPPDAPLRPIERDDGKAANGDPRPVIVIDPGHGGIDNGTRAPSGENEKVLVLEFALALRDKIEKVGKYRVVMTRADDTFIPLNQRVQIGRAAKASLFISIHADALVRRDSSAQGFTVYTVSERASDPAAARLAEAENRADVISGLDLSTEPPDVADILIDLARRETKTFSVQFARALIAEMRHAAKLHQNPLKSAGFRVLKAPDVPSVLVELGFVTNKDDVRALTSETWRGRAADAVVQAIDAFFKTRLAGGRN